MTTAALDSCRADRHLGSRHTDSRTGAARHHPHHRGVPRRPRRREHLHLSAATHPSSAPSGRAVPLGDLPGQRRVRTPATARPAPSATGPPTTYGEAMNSSDGRLGPRRHRPARSWCSPGPTVTPDEARAAVADLEAFAVEAHGHVAAFTGLDAPDRRPSSRASVVVVDRPGWIQANAAGFRTVLEPLIEKLQERRAVDLAGRRRGRLEGHRRADRLAAGVPRHQGARPVRALPAVRRRPPTDTPGRLLLVAPNIVAAEREMGVDPRDFRLWVCLHEETHRVQFGAVPWLREHLMSELRAFVEATDVDPAALAERLKAGVAAAYGAVREGFEPDAPDRGALAGRGGADPGAARDPGPHHRADVAARGPRRLRDGRRRPVGDPVGGDDPGEVPDPPQGGPPGSSRWCAGCSASTPSCGSTATASASCAAPSSGSAWTASTRCGPGRRTCPPRPRSPTPTAWVERVVTPTRAPRLTARAPP